MRLLAVYDYGEGKLIRYTAISDVKWDRHGGMTALIFNKHFGEWIECLKDGRFNPENNTWRTRTDIGKKIPFESLDADLQQVVADKFWGSG